LFLVFSVFFSVIFGYVWQIKLAIPVSNWALDNTVYRIVSHRIFDVGAGQLSKLRARNYVSGNAATLMVIFMPRCYRQVHPYDEKSFAHDCAFLREHNALSGKTARTSLKGKAQSHYVLYSGRSSCSINPTWSR